MNDQSSALVHAIAGCLGATTSLALFYPLDLMRTLRQAELAATEEKRRQSPRDREEEKQETAGLLISAKRQTFKNESTNDVYGKATKTMKLKVHQIKLQDLPKFYRGFLSSVCTQSVSFFVYFFAFRFIQSHSAPLGNTGSRDIVAAAIAGGINVLATNPLWVASTDIKTRKCKDGESQSMLKTMIRIYQERGIAGLWSGVLVSLVLVSNPSIQFAAYERLKNLQAYLRGIDVKQLAGVEYFIFGALAKALATIATYPLQVAQTILRRNRASTKKGEDTQQHTHNNRGMVAILLHLYRSKGVTALYTGLQMKFVQTILTSAFMFLCYEKILTLVARLVASATLLDSANN